MEKGQPAGEDPNPSESHEETGRDLTGRVARAHGPEIAAVFEANSDEARRLGIFGAPTFVVGEEPFWARTGSTTR